MSTGTDYSDRPSKENLPVTSRCIAIVLSRVHRDVTFENEQSFFSENNGKELLLDFKLRNKTCYWNPGLIESIASLEYLGFVKPSTLLVVGKNLENIRSAWGSRVLNAPEGFAIVRIGDVNGIEMQVVPQTKSVPLLDALCHIIMELNNHRIVATLDTIREKLQCTYQDIQLPTDKQLFDTLGNLIRDRKVFHTGSGYFVVTPETFRLPTPNEPNVTYNNWMQYQPMYIPVFQQQQISGQIQQQFPLVNQQTGQIQQQFPLVNQQTNQIQQQFPLVGQHPGGVPPHLSMMPQQTGPMPPSANMRSISCQAQAESTIVDKQTRCLKPRSRSQSVRGPKGSKEKEKSLENDDFKRVMSVRCKPEKAKEITKDLKSGEKVKGEKVSLFSKIFGRNKKKNSAPTPAVEETPVVEKEVEYATFSAQFPPPEWQWYQQQQEKHRRTEQWVTQQMVKSRTWHYIQNGAELPPSHIHSNKQEGGVYQTMGHSELTTGNIYSTLGRTHGGDHGDYMVIDGPVDPITGAPLDHPDINEIHREKTSHRKNHHDDKHSRERDLDKKGRDHVDRKSQECLDKIDSDTYGERKRHGHRKHRSTRNRKERHDQDENIDPYGTHGNKDPVSPVLAPDNFYQPLNSGPGPYHSTPRYYDTIPSRHPREDHTCTESQKHNTYRRSHRSHRSKKSHHRNTYYGHSAYHDMDISVEYHGKLPNKNSSYAQSCDSGVNCVGLKTESSSTKNSQKTRETTQHQFVKPLPVKNQLEKLPEEVTEKPKGDDGYVVMQSNPRRLPCNDGYDSSIMETPANTMIVCQAEINHQPIPQIVLDTEPQQQSCFEPDVAQSSSSNNGSRNELNNSSAKEGSCDTVVENADEDQRGNPAGEDNNESKPECLQDEHFLKPAVPTASVYSDREPQAYKVDSATIEVKELSLKDSGFSSPRYAEIMAGICPKQPGTYQKFQEHMAKPVLKVNNTVGNCCPNKDIHDNQNCVRGQPQYDGRPSTQNHDCQCHKGRCQDNHQMTMNNQRNIFRLKPENLVQSQWVDGPGSEQQQSQQAMYSTKQFRLSGEFEVVGVV